MEPHADRATGRLADALVDLHIAKDAGELLRQAARITHRTVAPQGASILVLDPRLSDEVAVASGGGSALHRVEAVALDGPSWTAAHELRTVHVPDVIEDRRWPQWSTAAREHGMRSVLSVGLTTPGRRTGALTAFSSHARRFTRAEVQTVERIAEHVSSALGWHRTVADRDDIIETRRMIGVATGLLMARYDVSDDQAFELMRRYSHVHHVKVRDVARHVVEHRELPPGRQ